VLSSIQQHIAKGPAHFTRRLQRTRVIAIREQPTAPPQPAIDRLGDANRKPLHPARERAAITGFRQQVQVVALNREMDQPEAKASASATER
jgi:hypothetical protein